MKKLVNVCCAMLLAVCLTGCSSHGISNRAIVKTILVDVEDGKYKASLVMLNCEPSSQIAETKETASIYTAVSADLNTAILNAEKKQCKSAFYAQNELLLINLKVIDSFDEIINYFMSESCARPGMTVFLTDVAEVDLKKSEQLLPKLINQIQSINVMNNTFLAPCIYDVAYFNKSYSAVFPILKINDNESSYIVDDMGVVESNSLTARLTGNDMAISAMLAKQNNFLNISTENFNFKLNAIRLSYEVVNGRLNCIITGNIKQADLIGEYQGKDNKGIATEINDYISLQCKNLYNQYLKENDILNYSWWLEMYGADENAEVEYVSRLIM